MCSLSLISDVFFLKDLFPDQLSLEQFFQKPVFCASVGVLASLRDVFLNNGISEVRICAAKLWKDGRSSWRKKEVRMAWSARG